MLVFELDDPPAAEAALEAALTEAGVPALVATSAAGRARAPLRRDRGIRAAIR